MPLPLFFYLSMVVRGLLTSHVDRRIGASKEQARREEMAEEMANGGYDGTQDDDDEMEF